jgi:putative addiction module component (TIGR02574 family)
MQRREFDAPLELGINLVRDSSLVQGKIMESQPTIFDLGIDQWSVDARLRLIDEIRESLPAGVVEETGEEFSEELKALLDERLAAADANPEALRPWREVMDELKSRR